MYIMSIKVMIKENSIVKCIGFLAGLSCKAMYGLLLDYSHLDCYKD